MYMFLKNKNYLLFHDKLKTFDTKIYEINIQSTIIQKLEYNEIKI